MEKVLGDLGRNRGEKENTLGELGEALPTKGRRGLSCKSMRLMSEALLVKWLEIW